MKENKGKCCERCAGTDKSSDFDDEACGNPHCECHCTIPPLVCSIHQHHIPQANSTVQGKVQDGVQAESWKKHLKGGSHVMAHEGIAYVKEKDVDDAVHTYIEQEKQRAVEEYKERLIAKVADTNAYGDGQIILKKQILALIREEK